MMHRLKTLSGVPSSLPAFAHSCVDRLPAVFPPKLFVSVSARNGAEIRTAAGACSVHARQTEQRLLAGCESSTWKNKEVHFRKV